MKKKLIKFVECKIAPSLRVWNAGSTLFYRCSCGQEVSFDTPGVETHWDKYEIQTQTPRTKDYFVWYAWLTEVQEKVAANKKLYRVTDWSE